jgi:hypothetical protein
VSAIDLKDMEDIGGGIGSRATRRTDAILGASAEKFNPCFVNDERVKFLVEVTGDDRSAGNL